MRVFGTSKLFFVVLIAFVTTPARGDVYHERQLTEDDAFSLSRLLKGAVVPGGTRHISINGADLQVKRHALPGRDKGSAVLDQIESGYESNRFKSTEITARYSALDTMIVRESPTDNIAAEAEDRVDEERDRIISELEQPFRYRAGIWDVYARIPVVALKPDSPLAGLPASDGFIYMAELSAENSQGYWEIRFGDHFQLGAILSDHKGDAPGYDPPVERYPGTRRTLTFEERANNWASSAWTFEGRGQMLEQSEHYVRQYERLGFVRKAIGARDEKQVMVQLAKGREQAVVYVVNTGKSQQPVQVLIQQSHSL